MQRHLLQNHNIINGAQHPVTRVSHDKRWLSNKAINRDQTYENKNAPSDLSVRKQPCGLQCPGARRVQPTMQCISCKCFYHAKCQGVSTNVKVINRILLFMLPK